MISSLSHLILNMVGLMGQLILMLVLQLLGRHLVCERGLVLVELGMLVLVWQGKLLLLR